jgi:hypothetical protein
MLESQLHFISAILILFASVVPIYLTLKLKGKLRKLVFILTIFILVHSVYHIVGFFGFTILAEGIFEPMSVAVLIFFGIAYSGMNKPKNLQIGKTMTLVWNPVIIFLLVDNLTLVLLLIAMGIFVWLALLAKSIRTFQFQISIFIIVWALGELAGILHESGIIVLSTLQDNIGLEIHVISMFFFSIMLWLRFYYSNRSGKKMIEDVDTTRT